MPPKKTNSGASKKTEIKKKEKVIEVSSELTTYLINQILCCTVSAVAIVFIGCSDTLFEWLNSLECFHD